MEEAGQDWANAAISASNLSETELLIGDIVAAMATAKKVVALADRAGNIPQILGYRTALPDVLHAAGEWGKAADLFADVERRQREVRPGHPFLYSLQGYRYCDSLLSQGRAVEARDRATLTLRRAKTHNFVLDVALDTLTLGRAHCTLALQSLARRASAEAARDDLRAAAFRLDGAVEGLLGSGDSARLVRGFIARAAFRRTVGDWDGANRDLDEAKEIAEPGLMRLYWCDCALEDARLALARREAFAPLNGLVEQSPPPPVLPDSGRSRAAQGRSAQRARRRAQAHRGMRLPSSRRGAGRSRRGRRRPPPFRRSAASGLRARYCDCLGVVVVSAGRGRGRNFANPRLRVETSFQSGSRLMFSGALIRTRANGGAIVCGNPESRLWFSVRLS